MNCNCPICKGRDPNPAGFIIAENEVVPFVKTYLLKIKQNRPLGLKYDGFLASLFAYSQAISYHRIHKSRQCKYFTDNVWMIKFKDELNNKFQEVIISDKSGITNELLKEVCEYNAS